MILRCLTFVGSLLPKPKIVKLTIILLLMLFCGLISAQTSIEDTKKQANQYFEEDEFTQAYKLYSQLVSNFPKDPDLNFKLGVCMIYSEPDKKKCLPYLQFANSRPNESPKEIKFYLGKAYHINYQFDEAIKFYNEYKKVGSGAKQKKLQVDREIAACGYGKRLLSNLSDLVVQSKKELNEADYFRSYDLKTLGGKLLVKPDEFKTGPDKRKKDKSVVFLPKIGDRVYFSSYGDNTDNGRDIFYKIKLPNGEYSKPVEIKGINTPYDEDYPFLHPNGKTIYFASKGHNSMGGYDIFKSTYISETDSWTLPENLEFPINSPDDDFLFVTDSAEKVAYFSTGRQSLPGKIDVLKVSIERKPIDVMALKGTVVKESSTQSLKSKITVKNIDKDELVGTYTAQDNGDYLMDLPNGAKLLYTVETPGLETQSQGVNLPLVTTSKPFKQIISYDKGILKIINYFNEASNDDSYLQYLKIIEQKAKLDVNEGKNKLVPTLVNGTAANTPTINGTGNTDSNTKTFTDVTDTTGTVKTNSLSAVKTNTSVTNKELINIAKKDAEDTKKEATQLNQDANDAYEIGTSKNIEADKKLTEADEALKNAEAITNNDEKKLATEKAIAIKQNAEIEKNTAEKILSYSKTLDEDAKIKIKIADLNKQYSEELEKIVANKTNKQESLTKLDDIQKQLNNLTGQKIKSDEFFNNLKNDVDDKEKQIASVENSNNIIKKDVVEIKEELTTNEAELIKAKKRDKPLIQEKINNLKTEETEKTTKITENELKLNLLKNELAGLNEQLALANKIKNENIAATKTNTVIGSNTILATNTNEAKNTPITQALQDKYKDKIVITDNTNKTNINQSTTELKNFNKEIDAAIAKNKTAITAAKTADEKNNITTELKNLEDLKKQNQTQIIANNKLAIGLNTTTIASTTNTTTVEQGKTTSEVLQDKYKDKIVITDETNKDNINQSTTQLKNFNKEIDAAIAKNKTASANAKTTTEKNKINTEIKNLEDLKKQNQTQIAANTKLASASDNATSATAQQNSLLTPISTTNTTEAITQLQKLNANLNGNDGQNFAFNAYQNTTAQQLKSDADAKINSASAEQKKLIEKIAMANNELSKATTKTNVSGTSNQTPQQLSKEAEELANKSIEVLNEAKTKTGPEKDKLTAESKELQTKSNEKNLLAAEIAKNDNKAIFDTNNQNIQLLITENKSTETENTEAKKLNNEALIAYNQAKTIREEALSQTNIGAKLGGLSNAEEKEAEALNKQKQAVDLLKKSNPNANLNTALTSASNAVNSNSSTPTTNNDDLIAQKLNDVNKSIDTLSDLKLAAYQKLFEANKLEIEQLNTNLSNNNSHINNTPALKSEYIATTTKMASAETLKQKSDADLVKNDKLTNLINATKKQIEAINQLNKLTKKVDAQLAKNTIATNSSNTNGNDNTNTNVAVNTTTKSTTQNNNSTDNTNTSVAVNTDTKTTNGNDNTNNKQTPLIDINTLSKTDTTAAQTLSYFENKNTKLSNPEANTYISNSLIELKKIEEETKQLQIASAQSTATSSQNTNTVNPTELKTKSDELLQAAEELSTKAANTKTEANTKKGKEKDNLLAKAKEYEDESNAKKLDASNLIEQSNTINYTTNNTSITELLVKLKTDNPALAIELEQKNNELKTVKTQAANLRTEANAQTNASAKIGGLGNAEEKEAELLQKQTTLLNELKKTYPNYVADNQNNTTKLTPEEITQKQNQLNENKNTALTNLTNAFTLEYETNKTKIPVNLNANQKAVKQNADDLNAESKRLLIQSANETNPNQKVKLLSLAAKTGNAAVEQLNTLTKTSTLASNNPRTNTNANNTTNNPRNNTNNTAANNTNPRNNNQTNTTTNPRNNTATNNTNTTTNTNPRNNQTTNNNTIKIEGLEVTSGNAYNANRPIPVDSKIPDGLVFRVQIGAFKNQLPNNAFKGLSPVNAETVGNGYLRYTAGNFNQLENANAVKNDLRNLGYNDAFVVVYYNGKRILLNEALAILEKEGKTINTNAPQTAGINANSNVPKATTNPIQNQVVNPQDAVIVTKELEQIKNMLFTVQIGVYSKKVTKQQLQNIKPIFTEKLTNGLYRYTAGIYNNGEKIITDKRRVVDLGIKDAFVSAYLDGKRIDFNEARNRQQSDSTVKMEAENPIIFTDAIPRVDNSTGTASTNTNSPTNTNTAVTNIQPFKNNVTSYPEATAENGIKANEEGVCFKVQIGAYSKQVPNEVAAKFSAIKNWPIENKQINALFIYNVGNYTEAKYAKDLKDEAIRLGINDAFISVYRDGKKLFGADASALLNR